VDEARLAADHRFRKGEGVVRKKRKEVEASVPARIHESPGLVARTSKCSLQKSVGDGQASNKLGKRAPKRAAGSSERGSSAA